MRRRRSGLIFLLGVLPLFLAAPSLAQSTADRKAALERLRSAAGGQVEARWSPDHGRVRTLAGHLAPARAGAPEDVARTFLLEARDIFTLRTDLGDLSLRGVRSSPSGTHVGFDQSHAGLPVFDGGLDVHLDTAGSVYLVQSSYAADLDAATTPRITAAAAVAAARRHFMTTWRPGADKSGRPVASARVRPRDLKATDPRLGILSEAASPVLVYRFELHSEEPVALVQYSVNAQDGSIVQGLDLVQTATDGSGRAFDPNPVVALNDPTLTDHGDAADPSLAPAYVDVPLLGIKRLFTDRFGPYTLSGPYAMIADLTEPPFSPLVYYSADARFPFARDHQGFEAVMGYFHIDRNQRYIQSLGFLDVNNRALRIDPHGLGGDDNSHYVPLPIGAGYVAFGEGGVDDAEDADVLMHEYGHAIQDNQNPGRYLPFGQMGAMGEGFGDYWAFSNGNQTGFDPPCIGEWDFEGTCLRRVDGTKHFPEDLAGEVHADGEIWSSVLHAAFEEIGKEKADRIVLESHFLVPSLPDFCDGSHALEQAAGSLYGAPEAHAFAAAAAARGIGGDLTIRNLYLRPPVGGGSPFPRLTFDIVNQGPCTIRGAANLVLVPLVYGGYETIASFNTGELGPAESASFEITVPDMGLLYVVKVDAHGFIPETDESNNEATPGPPPPVGNAPVIQSFDLSDAPAMAECDYTVPLQGLLCEAGISIDLFVPPFPIVRVIAGYTEVGMSSQVVDADSTPSQSDVLLVAGSFLIPAPGVGVQEVSVVLLDDGSANAFTFEQSGVRAENCTVDPAAGICQCLPARFPLTSHDTTANDDLYTRVMAMVTRDGGALGINAEAMLWNCIARQNLSPVVAPNGTVPIKLEAVDRSGNIVSWPLVDATVQPSSLTCHGDDCGCCLLISTNPTASPAEGGCAGLPGLPGVPGSGFENGLCVDLIPTGLSFRPAE